MDNYSTKWFDKALLENEEYEKFVQNPIAYFCAEFALSDLIPIYAGGLGVLAGDLVKEADFLGIPLVGIGLLYKKGFFKQEINDKDEQVETEQPINPRAAGLKLILNSEGNIFTTSIPVKGREIHFQVWNLKIGSIDLYLLDTDTDLNSLEDRKITETLYGEEKTIRILQEIVLGIGGEKILFALGIYPSIYHMNEGHSAFAAFGITHHRMKITKDTYQDAFEKIKKKLIFTNHTIVPAGNDVFPKELVSEYLSDYASEVGIPLDEFINKGLTPQGEFSMTIFALNLSYKVNAVSNIHAMAAKKIWPEYNFETITNGVNLKNWMEPTLHRRLEDRVLQENISFEDAPKKIAQEDLWLMHQSTKEALLTEIFNITGSILDKNILTLTWARRITQYKMPDLIFLDIESLSSILNNIQKPVQIIIAGKSHPNDTIGKEIVHNILENIRILNQPNRIVFIPNYSLSLARFLVSGSDVWLNTPQRGQEACGTSGMKSGANGALQFSVSDGWVDEVDWQNAAWIIDDKDPSMSLYTQLRNDITSLYYNKPDGVPHGWVERMVNTMNIVLKNYSTKRMLIDYFNKLYLPSLKDQED